MLSGNRKALLVLSFAVAVVTLGFGLVTPILPFYMERLGAGGTELGLLVASYAVVRLICGPIWASLSDRVGRKPILLVGVLGYGLAMVGFGLATRLWMMYVARVLSGLLSSATSPTAMAYIGDHTSEEERSRSLGLLGAAGGLGTVLGPALGGLLAGRSLGTPFFAAGLLSLVALFLIWLLLPESPGEREPSAPLDRQPVIALGAWRRTAAGPSGPLLGMAFLATAGLMALYGVLGLYALERFGLGTERVGVLFTILGLVTAVGQGLLVGPLSDRYGDAKVIRFGFLLAAVTLAAVGLAERYVGLVAVVGLFSLASAVLMPAITSLTSRSAAESQGVVMGLNNASVSLGRAAGPLLGGLAFDLHWSLPIWCGTVLLLGGLAVSLPGGWAGGSPAPNADAGGSQAR